MSPVHYKDVPDGKLRTYVGTKIVQAQPQTKMWDAPESDAAIITADGYKVTYEDGYTSWSPKEVFDKAYIHITDSAPGDFRPHVLRMKAELGQLMYRLVGLHKALFGDDNNVPLSIPADDRALMQIQYNAMQTYAAVLTECLRKEGVNQ